MLQPPQLTDSYTQAWILWIIQFFVIEGAALLRKDKGDTLTEHFRDWFALKDKPSGWKWRRSSLGLFLAWLAYHFFVQ